MDLADEKDQRPDSLAFVGEGELPAEFDRVNWGAWAFAPIWALLYGPRRWTVALLTVLLAPILIDNVALLFFDSRTTFPAVQRLTGPTFAVVWPVLCGAYAVLVNRLVWERERARLAASSAVPAGAIPLRRYRSSHRFWGRLFVLIFCVWWSALAWLVVSGGLTLREAIAPGVSAVVLPVLFVIDRHLIQRRARLEGGSRGKGQQHFEEEHMMSVRSWLAILAALVLFVVVMSMWVVRLQADIATLRHENESLQKSASLGDATKLGHFKLTSDWVGQPHADVTARNGAEGCFDCHQETDCSDCHINLPDR